ncbi:hypothetical protein MSG28_007307 [Choristoneura fumiferana]|uniref:Uncharacterized protein n=1 Tax=Choristoneura fumiferana TaxID=7141 RepID=A0ACC0JWJ4_CHOFU|nr:hypothetical protein MSG28_007307 [Choristoneura fumiferana]
MKNTKVVGCKAERPTLLLSAVLNARGRATRRAPQPPPARARPATRARNSRFASFFIMRTAKEWNSLPRTIIISGSQNELRPSSYLDPVRIGNAIHQHSTKQVKASKAMLLQQIWNLLHSDPT